MQFEVFDLGLIDFAKARQFQKELFSGVKAGYLKSGLILCRHYPVITLGRSAKKENILISEQELKARGIQVYEIERGGDVTYHGPGQIIAYPVFNLDFFKKDIRFFLRFLEEIIIDLLGDFGINVERQIGLTGVWVGKRKIASIGIAIRNWITFHGLSINIKANDLQNFKFIRPCGMDIDMTSIETESGRNIEIAGLKENLICKFKEVANDQSSLAGIR